MHGPKGQASFDYSAIDGQVEIADIIARRMSAEGASRHIEPRHSGDDIAKQSVTEIASIRIQSKRRSRAPVASQAGQPTWRVEFDRRRKVLPKKKARNAIVLPPAVRASAEKHHVIGVMSPARSKAVQSRNLPSAALPSAASMILVIPTCWRRLRTIVHS